MTKWSKMAKFDQIDQEPGKIPDPRKNDRPILTKCQKMIKKWSFLIILTKWPKIPDPRKKRPVILTKCQKWPFSAKIDPHFWAKMPQKWTWPKWSKTPLRRGIFDPKMIIFDIVPKMTIWSKTPLRRGVFDQKWPKIKRPFARHFGQILPKMTPNWPNLVWLDPKMGLLSRPDPLPCRFWVKKGSRKSPSPKIPSKMSPFWAHFDPKSP